MSREGNHLMMELIRLREDNDHLRSENSRLRRSFCDKYDIPKEHIGKEDYFAGIREYRNHTGTRDNFFIKEAGKEKENGQYRQAIDPIILEKAKINVITHVYRDIVRRAMLDIAEKICGDESLQGEDSLLIKVSKPSIDLAFDYMKEMRVSVLCAPIRKTLLNECEQEMLKGAFHELIKRGVNEEVLEGLETKLLGTIPVRKLHWED